MKTSLTLAILASTLAAPTAFAAELAGLSLPAWAQPHQVAGAYVAAALLLTFLADYARPSRLAARPVLARPGLKSEHALAA